MASHDLTKFVDANGDEFNVRDTTKQPVADRVTSVRASSSASDDKYPSEKAVAVALDDYRTKLQDVSKGANLVVNGNGVVGNNYNFGARTFIGNTDLPEGTAGCFHAVANTIWHDEPIAVDVGKTYEAEVWYRVKSANTSTVRFSVCCFDVDDKEIQAIFSTYGVGTLTELTQDLKPGDTVVHLADLSGANWLSETNYHHGFIFWNYQNSLGYTYPPETYSRNVYPQGNVYLWDDSSAVNVSAGTITLKSAWNGPTIPAGTKVSRRNSGGTYKYIQIAASSSAATAWEKLSGKVFGMTNPGSTDGGSFRPGTAYVRVGFYNSSTDGNEYIEFTGLSFRELPTKLATARKLKTDLARTAASTFDGSADQESIPVKGTLPVGNGGTGKASVTAGNYVVGNGNSALTEKTPKDAGNDVLKSLDTDNGDVVDGDYIVTSYHVDASTISSTTFVRRTAENLWNYIKSKISSVLGLSTTGYTGNAATATALEAGGAHRTKLDGIEEGANNYVHPTSAGNKHVPSGGSDGKFLGYGGSSGTAAWVDNPAAGKADDVSFVFTANGADANLNARLLAAVKLSGSTLSSVRLSFVMAVDIGIGSDGVKGGILRADIAVSSNGQFFAKNCWLTAVTGRLSSSDFKIAYGQVSGGNMAVGVVHDGTLNDGRSLYVRVLDSYVSGGDLVTNAAITAGKTYEAWGYSNDSAGDATVVHNTGDESVAGKKTFTDPVVESVSSSGEYGGFFVQRGSTAATRYRASLEVVDSGSRGLYDYGGSSYAGEDKWIIRKSSDNYIDVGEASNRNKVRLGGVTLDFSGTVGNVADTFYIAN